MTNLSGTNLNNGSAVGPQGEVVLGVEVGAGATKWVASHFFRAPGVVTPAARNLRAVVKGSAVVEIPVTVTGPVSSL